MNVLENFLHRRLHLVSVKFDQPWWLLLTNQKWSLSVAFLGEVASGIFSPLRITLLGWIFAMQRYDYLWYLFGIWIVIYAINFFARFYNTIVQMRSVESVIYQAHKKMLQIDPVFHANRSSGTILSKIERGARAYEDLLQTFFFDLVELPISIITSLVALALISIKLVSITILFLGIIVILSTVVIRRFADRQELEYIKADDSFKSLCIENLFQINFIRAVFAAVGMNIKMSKAAVDVMKQEAKLAAVYNVAFTLIKCIYLVSFITVCYFALTWVQAGVMSSVMAISLVLSYMRGTYEIIRIEKPLRVVYKSITRIKDLYAYINTCGEQSYPVLNEDVLVQVPETKQLAGDNFVTVSMKKLFFDYAPNAKIFNDHSLQLSVQHNQQSMLYGIIGPSGIGKSTLLSMIGGQLRPTSGRVELNTVDIYAVNDSARQRLITLQGQVATSVRGSLEYNLLFGLPHDAIFSQEQLIDVLLRVGLWQLFKEKDGLATSIGEGGFTLSGGQRQRLNFANLYLRATYFKPLVILIDEPTSSLDDVSEKKITEMIFELSRNAVTFVIAHRLTTVAQATGLLDCSLLPLEKEMVFYSHKELMQRSSYYQELMTGDKHLEQDIVG